VIGPSLGKAKHGHKMKYNIKVNNNKKNHQRFEIMQPSTYPNTLVIGPSLGKAKHGHKMKYNIKVNNNKKTIKDLKLCNLALTQIP
jgi:hypothetical protein